MRPTPPASSSRITTGQALAYVYFDERTGASRGRKLLTKDEARRIAAPSNHQGPQLNL